MTKSTDLAKTYLGVQEVTPNDGPVLKTIREALLYPGAPPCSWCALFVAWCLIRAYCPLPGSPGPSHRFWLKNALAWGGAPTFLESTNSWMDGAQKFGAFTTEPCEGDLFLLLRPDGRSHHIGFVTQNLAPLFHTIEGNTNAGGSVNGDGVYERTRAMEEGVRFISLPSVLKA